MHAVRFQPQPRGTSNPCHPHSRKCSVQQRCVWTSRPTASSCSTSRESPNATDYFLIASGSSDTHVRAIAEHVMEELKKEGVRAHHVEGLAQGRWVLLDYVDFVVHVFHPTLRDFYQLERLWGDARIVAIDAEEAKV